MAVDEDTVAGGAFLTLLTIVALFLGWVWWQGAKGAYEWAFADDHLWWCTYGEPHAALPTHDQDQYVEDVPDAGGSGGLVAIHERSSWRPSGIYRLADMNDRASYAHVIAVDALVARAGVIIWGLANTWFLWVLVLSGLDDLSERGKAKKKAKSRSTALPPAPEPDFSHHEPGSYIEKGEKDRI